ncbi:hypothetical protein EZV62_017918 [Acer yangbiense]|uniref:NAC domain-containing protein n=1 Tax=Acer yangbiense TaxID=1000413 RepID=A0A5C7HIN2_9ROSI|nr:hypothetical protein EZV62_017918 [Acer yangbiense]
MEQQQQLPADIETEIKKLPVGFRFRPPERDLILNYLINKILNRSLPSNAIKDIHFYDFDPDQLPISEFSVYCKENQAYFFTQVVQGGRRTTKSGHWKASDFEEEPVLFKDGKTVGFKKKFVFYSGDQKTYWTMREYRVNPDLIPSNAPNEMIDSYVICKIKYKDTSEKRKRKFIAKKRMAMLK